MIAFPSSSTSDPTGLPQEAHSNLSKSNPGPIAGGVVGGVAVLALIAILITLFIRRRNARKKVAPSAEFMNSQDPFAWGRSAPAYAAIDEGAESPRFSPLPVDPIAEKHPTPAAY